MPILTGTGAIRREIAIDEKGLYVVELEGANEPIRVHDIDVVDNGSYINIGCIRVSRAAWVYIKSKVR